VISLGQIGPYCTSVHIITFPLFALLVYDATGTRDVVHISAGT
jgi:uncharacterized membrane protein